MGAKNVTAADRLAILIPWLNGDDVDPEDVALRFLNSFNVDRGVLGVLRHTGHDGAMFDFLETRLELLEILQWADASQPPLKPLQHLRFSIVTADDGRYRFLVHGDAQEALLFAFMQTLTEAAPLGLCPAPAPHDWTRPCDRLFVIQSGRGRRRKYCSDSCRVRMDRWKNSDYGGLKNG